MTKPKMNLVCPYYGYSCEMITSQQEHITRVEKELENSKRTKKFERKDLREKRIQGERSIKRAEINILQEANEKLKTELRIAREQIDIMHKGGMACCPVCKTLVKLRERHLCYQEVK